MTPNDSPGWSGSSGKAGPIDIPVVQLPIDLQNEIASDAGSFGTGAFSARAREVVVMAVLLVAGAAASYGIAGLIAHQASPFEDPLQWLTLLVGATVTGLVLGERARIDIRPYGITKWLLGPASLVRVERDVVHVYPAEHLVHDGDNLRISSSGVAGAAMLVDASQHVPPREQIDAVRAAAADPRVRAADRWRAAAVGRPAPIRRWTPALHGAGLGVAIALAVDALAPAVDPDAGPHAATWAELEWRATVASTRLLEHRAERELAELREAAANGPVALAELAVQARRDGNGDLEQRAQAALTRAVTGPQLDDQDLDRLQTWFGAAERARLESQTTRAIADAYGRKLVIAARDMDLAELTSREAAAWDIDAPRDGTYARFDELFAASITPATQLDDTIGALSALHVPAESLPRTATAMAAIAARLAQAAASLDDIALAEPYLDWPTDKLHTAYQRAYEHELRGATLESIGQLLDRASAHDVGDADQVNARAEALFVAGVNAAVTPADLQQVDAAARSVIDSDRVTEVVQARGMLLARRAVSLDDRAAWVSWLDDDALALQLYRSIVAAGTGTIASTAAMAGALDNISTTNTAIDATLFDDVAKAHARLEAMCAKAFPDASLGADFARHLAAHQCTKPEPSVVVSHDSDDSDADDQIATSYANRAAALLGAAGGPRVLVIRDDGMSDLVFGDDHAVAINGDPAEFTCSLTKAGVPSCVLVTP